MNIKIDMLSGASYFWDDVPESTVTELIEEFHAKSPKPVQVERGDRATVYVSTRYITNIWVLSATDS